MCFLDDIFLAKTCVDLFIIKMVLLAFLIYEPKVEGLFIAPARPEESVSAIRYEFHRGAQYIARQFQMELKSEKVKLQVGMREQ